MQKNSGIGGQAVMEGIMMRNADRYSISVRKPNGEIETKVDDYRSVCPWKGVWKVPLLRGVVSFIDSLVVGMSSLMFSADIAAEEDTDESGNPLPEKTEAEKAKDDRLWKVLMTVTVIISIGFSVVLFMLLPFWLAGLMRKAGVPDVGVNLAEALLRIAIFLTYMLLISRMKDIQRVFAYHGAEHKCINCIESGMDLTVENVMKSSRQHRRCGTSFLLIVVCISVIAFLILGLFGIRSGLWRFLWRIILIPVIAGVSYEILRYGGSHDGKCINLLVQPGLRMQLLVTREPDEKMCEVAITAIESVFDWRVWQGKAPKEEEA